MHKKITVAVLAGLLTISTVQPAVAKDKTPGFDKAFASLPAFMPDTQALIDLGDADGPMFDPNLVEDDNPNGDPSVFTYFGQFIDHDITLDGQPSPTAPVDISTLTNGRTPYLDLDSVYGAGEGSQFFDSAGKFLLAANGRDYVRRADGSAIINEGRNDENLVIAQIQVAVMRFHNALIDQGLSFSQARRETVFHYQWVILHDFLPRIIEPQILQDALDGKKPRKNDIDLPIEFTVAAYRFGHSMVRKAYFMGDKVTKVQVFNPNGNDLRGGRVIPANLIIDWTNFASIPGSPFGPINISRKIDPLLSSGLFTLPPGAIPSGGPIELAARNMIRGKFYGLESGQDVANAMSLTPLTNTQLGLADPRFSDKAPLWFYILGEAKYYHNGAYLGPVGSQLVAEQLIGMLKSSVEKGILHPSNKNWFPRTGGNFKIGDLLRIAGVA